jgi:hypothetical protein
MAYIFTLLMFKKPNKTTINKHKTKFFLSVNVLSILVYKFLLVNVLSILVYKFLTVNVLSILVYKFLTVNVLSILVYI